MPVDVFQDYEATAILLAPHIVHLDNPRVLFEVGHRPRLFQQAPDLLLAGKPIVAPDLDGHVAFELLVMGAIHGSVSAVAEDADDPVAADPLGRYARR
jgi:hypothetical protein